jgi:hypothetical protein
MSLASDISTLYSQGFIVDVTGSHYRLRRVKVDSQMPPGGDLGSLSGSLQTAVTAALGIVAAQLTDEASRRAIGTQQLFGAPLSWNPHTGQYI